MAARIGGEIEALDADHDPRTGWTVMVAGLSTDEGGAIVWIAVHESGQRDLQTLVGRAPGVEPRLVNISESGAGTFLVAWPDDVAGGAIRAMRMTCDAS